MDDIKLSLSQAGPSGELSIIRVDGIVDTITASELESVIEGLLEQRRYRILVDLGGVEYISSAGWGIFVSKIQEIRDNNGDIKLVNMVPNVFEIYELLEFEHIIKAFETLELGKKAFNLPSGGDSGGERVWKTDRSALAKPGTSLQEAMSPGTRDTRRARGGAAPTDHGQRSAEEVILQLVAEDPFASISELIEEVTEITPGLQLTWWKVFGILRRNRLLRHRSRFRLARKRRRQ